MIIPPMDLSKYNSSNPCFVFRELIGNGTFGHVYKVYDVNSGTFVAVKRTIKKGPIVSREFKILMEVRNCSYCIYLIDIFYTIDKENLIQNLVFEYMPTSLGKIFRTKFLTRALMDHDEIVCVMWQLLKGMEFLHKNAIIHRDLKPDNILLSENYPYKVKICDFGSSKKVSDLSTPYIVSRFYRAPELIFCKSIYGPEIDIWSAGCIFLEFYTGYPIFRGHTDGDQFIQIARILGSPCKDDLINLSTVYLSNKLIAKTLSIGARQNLTELFIDSPKPKEAEDLALKMLMWDPKKRFTAKECLDHEFFK